MKKKIGLYYYELQDMMYFYDGKHITFFNDDVWLNSAFPRINFLETDEFLFIPVK